jgi:hypothetical protein
MELVTDEEITIAAETTEDTGTMERVPDMKGDSSEQSKQADEENA